MVRLNALELLVEKLIKQSSHAGDPVWLWRQALSKHGSKKKTFAVDHDAFG